MKKIGNGRDKMRESGKRREERSVEIEVSKKLIKIKKRDERSYSSDREEERDKKGRREVLEMKSIAMYIA